MKKPAFLFGCVITMALLLTAVMPTNAQSGLPPLCSGVQLQNPTSTDATTVAMSFYKQGENDSVANYVYSVSGGIPKSASKSFYIPSILPSTVPSGKYAVIVSSNEQLNSLVNQVTCSGSTPFVYASHTGFNQNQISQEVYLVYVMSRAFGQKWSSAVAIQNAGSGNALNVQIQFYQPGSSTPVETFTNTDLKVGETWYLDLSTGTYATTALNGFAGSAKITSDQPVAAIANYAPGDGSRLQSYNGVPSTSSSQKIYATQVSKLFASQGYTAGLTLYNPNSTSTPISIKFYRSGQTSPDCTINDSVGAYASYIKYLGSAVCTTGSLPNAWNGYAVAEVTSGTNKILGIFNYDSVIGHAGAANMPPIEQASTTIYFPQIVRNAFGGYQAGWQVVNTTTSNLNLTIEYWRDNNTLTFTDHKVLNGSSALTNYVGSAAFQSTIGDNWNGGVIVKVDGGAGNIVGQANFVAPAAGDAWLIYNGFPGTTP